MDIAYDRYRWLKALCAAEDGYACALRFDGAVRDTVPRHAYVEVGSDADVRVLGDLLGEFVLAHRGDVYCGTWLYREARRSSKMNPNYVCGSRVVWVDDGKRDVDPPWSWWLQTSEASGQGVYLLSEPLTAQECLRLRRYATVVSGGDERAIDLARVGRFPGSVNRKPGRGDFVSRLVDDRDVRYSAAELTAALVVHLVPDGGPDREMVRRALGRLDRLTIAHQGIPWPRRIAYRRIENPVVPLLLSGRPVVGGREDRDLARLLVAQSLVMHGYPDDEAMALLLTLCRYGEGEEVVWESCLRALTMAVREFPDIRRSGTAAAS